MALFTRTTFSNMPFFAVSDLRMNMVPDVPGLYCVKAREEAAKALSKYGSVRNDGIIYIGKASVSLRTRLWEQELNHKSAATFFRSIGAMLGYLPPKGSLYGKSSRNYKFNLEDTEAIREWMRQSLMVNWIPLDAGSIDSVEESLIMEYRPLVNIEHNPSASEALKSARKHSVEYAKNR